MIEKPPGSLQDLRTAATAKYDPPASVIDSYSLPEQKKSQRHEFSQSGGDHLAASVYVLITIIETTHAFIKAVAKQAESGERRIMQQGKKRTREGGFVQLPS